MKKIFAIFLLFCLALCGCEVSSGSDEATATQTLETTYAEDTTEVETTEEITTEPSNELEEILDVIAPVIAYPNLSIDYDGSSVIVEYWYDGLSVAVSMAKNGDQSKINAWNNYIELEKKQCATLKAILEEEGFFVPVVWNVIDDQNRDELLLQIVDGEIVCNAVEQE